MNATYKDIMGEIEIPPHLEADAEVPVLTGLQRQGDVYVIPQPRGKIDGLQPIPPEGIVVVRGEAGGNTHRLMADGPCFWASSRDRFIQGSLVVEEGGTAYLIHEEHGAQGIGHRIGSYFLRRQRQQEEEITIAAD